MKLISLLITCLMILNINLIFGQAGTLDTTFKKTGKVITDFGGNDFGRSVAIQPDGKIVVAGYTLTGNNFAVARYNKNGRLDKTFGGSGKVTTDFGLEDLAYSVAIQVDGKIVVAGKTNVNTSSTGVYDFAVARYNINGTLDYSFSGDGKVTTDFNNGGSDEAHSVAIQSDGKIVVIGFTNKFGSDYALARYNANGTPDNTFGGSGKIITNFGVDTYSEAYAVIIQPDGKIVVAGDTNAGNDFSDFGLARYNVSGTLDNTFSGDGKVIADIGGYDFGKSVAIQPDGKIVVAGYTIQGDEDWALARFNVDGTLDNLFNGSGKVTTEFGGVDDAYAVAIQANGKIVVAGYSKPGTDYDFTLARYNTNGTLDNTFSGDGKVATDFSGGSGDDAFAIAIQPDGKIVAAGDTRAISGSNDFAVARYNGDATLLTNNVSRLNVTDIINERKSPFFRLYPNPVTDVLHVQGLSQSAANTILITDVSGKVFEKATALSGDYTFNVKMLPAGVYNISIIENRKTVNYKIIKQ
ncbi:MAG: T9SS type A sorting domain-containing protein [Chitinophagales bacterium]|nr:T9SS type A sorting domain-containing protein [Chitinophagales bacterium]